MITIDKQLFRYFHGCSEFYKAFLADYGLSSTLEKVISNATKMLYNPNDPSAMRKAFIADIEVKQTIKFLQTLLTNPIVVKNFGNYTSNNQFRIINIQTNLPVPVLNPFNPLTVSNNASPIIPIMINNKHASNNPPKVIYPPIFISVAKANSAIKQYSEAWVGNPIQTFNIVEVITDSNKNETINAVPDMKSLNPTHKYRAYNNSDGSKKDFAQLSDLHNYITTQSARIVSNAVTSYTTEENVTCGKWTGWIPTNKMKHIGTPMRPHYIPKPL